MQKKVPVVFSFITWYMPMPQMIIASGPNFGLGSNFGSYYPKNPWDVMGVKTTCFAAPGVSLGGSGVCIGGFRILRVLRPGPKRKPDRIPTIHVQV